MLFLYLLQHVVTVIMDVCGDLSPIGKGIRTFTGIIINESCITSSVHSFIDNNEIPGGQTDL